jgi:hypothetical protein
MFIKKFYDMDAADNAAASNETTNSSQTESIASIMAREGVKSGAEESSFRPIQLSNNSSDEDSRSTAAPAKDDSSSRQDDNYQETSYNRSEKTESYSSDYDLSTVLSKEQPENVLKALGFDDKSVSFINELKNLDPKMVGFFETWKQGGDIKAYFDEASKDFSQMPAEDVMRHQLRLDYPRATEAQLDILYKKEIVEKYNLNSYDEDEVNEGKLLLEAKADKYRDQLQQLQQDKLIPSSSQYSEQQIAQQQAVMEYANGVVKEFSENPYTREVLSKNSITIGEGSDKFVFPIDGKEIADLVVNGDTSGDLMFDRVKGADGSEQLVPKAEHQLLVATVNKYGSKFITELAKHYKSLGSRAAIEPIDNARPSATRTPSGTESEPTTIAGAMAKYGRVNSGG